MSNPNQEVTELLLEWSHGDKAALDRLMPLVCEELRSLARRYLEGESGPSTLQPTALVNEVYLRLVDIRRVTWHDRAHFFAFAARTMRRILVDYARARRSAKRGGGLRTITLEDRVAGTFPKEIDLIDLDEALEALARLDDQQSRLVELRFFAGLTVDETADVMGIGRATVSRYWKLAKAFLHRELHRRRSSAARSMTAPSS